MRTLISSVLLLGLTCTLVGCVLPPPSAEYETIGSIDRRADAADATVPRGAEIEVLARGFTWPEGPVWMADEQALYFNDVPENTMYRWSLDAGLATFMSPSGGATDAVAETMREPGANGIIKWPADESKLLLADHGARGLSVLDRETQARRVIVSSYQGQSLNSPNDMVAHSSGDVFFTDPPYGLRGLNDAPEKALQHNGVYRLSPDGDLTLIESDLSFPNGIGLSPDEQTLYVAVSDPETPVIRAYRIDASGTIDDGRTFFDAASELKDGGGLPDGMAIASNGTLFATGPEGVYILAPETGQVLGVISTGMPISNCTLNEDETYLYMTSSSVLARVPVTIDE
ncbi:MAG: SMP-30/gluconolactonase/LRE family protein [Pseudomonadota bacterium]|nr:SMP-30/gluconolactonase/LRE family protein [Pseudomonadota bacterium]